MFSMCCFFSQCLFNSWHVSYVVCVFVFFFFFQAEDGIRDHCVTGVQTCALPILLADLPKVPL